MSKQLDFFALLDEQTREKVRKTIAGTGRPAPIGPVIGTKLEILREVESRKFGRRGQKERYVAVRCQCGVEKEVQLKHIRNRNTKSCGQQSCCTDGPSQADLMPKIGDRFGSRTVIEIQPSENVMDSIVVCACDCGFKRPYRITCLRELGRNCQKCRPQANRIQFVFGQKIGVSTYERDCLGTYSKSGVLIRRVLLKCKCGKLFASPVHRFSSRKERVMGCGCSNKREGEIFKIGEVIPHTYLTYLGDSVPRSGVGKRTTRYYGRFRCECGIYCTKDIDRVMRGRIVSCGCYGADGRTKEYKRYSGRQLNARVLGMAGGKCECCEFQAPFITKKGGPYLEVHHVVPIGGGFKGWNAVDNAVALCPNCHREIHYGMHGDILADSLYAKVPRLRRCKSPQDDAQKTVWTAPDGLFGIV